MRREWLFSIVGFALGGLTGALAFATLTPVEDSAPVLAESLPTVPAQAAAEDSSIAIRAVAPAADSASPQPADPVSDQIPSPIPTEIQARLAEIATGWSRIEEEMSRLRRRVVDLEQQLTALQARSGSADNDRPRRLGATPDGQRTAMVKAGVAEEVAAELIRRQGQQSLDRLNLRDIAAREGWLGTDRYREELARIDEDNMDLRGEMGDEVYDRYLFAAGEDNRVRVDGIIPGSVGEMAGLQPGDLIESYAGEAVLTFSDLREATSGGERGELVQVRVRRGDQIFETWVARGPLGVNLDGARAEPR